MIVKNLKNNFISNSIFYNTLETLSLILRKFIGGLINLH